MVVDITFGEGNPKGSSSRMFSDGNQNEGLSARFPGSGTEAGFVEILPFPKSPPKNIRVQPWLFGMFAPLSLQSLSPFPLNHSMKSGMAQYSVQ